MTEFINDQDEDPMSDEESRTMMRVFTNDLDEIPERDAKGNLLWLRADGERR